MAKLAAFPKCFIEDISSGKMALDEWLDMAGTLPIDGVELYAQFLESHSPAYLTKLREDIRRRNLEMPMMCYSPDFATSDRAAWNREVAGQREIIKVTAELDGHFCRILSGQRRSDVSVEDGIKWVVEAIEACIQTARENDIVLAMENHYKDTFWTQPEFAQRSDVFMAIIDQIDSPYFGVQYDPSNAIVAGEDPLAILERVKHRVKTMHASDRYLAPGATLDGLRQSDGTIGYSPDLCHGVTGQGLNDYDAIFRALSDVGFRGWISIEDGMNGLSEIDESAQFLRKKLHEHGLAESETR